MPRGALRADGRAHRTERPRAAHARPAFCSRRSTGLALSGLALNAMAAAAAAAPVGAAAAAAAPVPFALLAWWSAIPVAKVFLMGLIGAALARQVRGSTKCLAVAEQTPAHTHFRHAKVFVVGFIGPALARHRGTL